MAKQAKQLTFSRPSFWHTGAQSPRAAKSSSPFLGGGPPDCDIPGLVSRAKLYDCEVPGAENLALKTPAPGTCEISAALWGRSETPRNPPCHTSYIRQIHTRADITHLTGILSDAAQARWEKVMELHGFRRCPGALDLQKAHTQITGISSDAAQARWEKSMKLHGFRRCPGALVLQKVLQQIQTQITSMLSDAPSSRAGGAQ